MTTNTPYRNHLDRNRGRYLAPFISWDATTYPTKLSLTLLETSTARWSSSGWDPCPAWSSMGWRTSKKCSPSRDTISIPGPTLPDIICSSVETRRTVRKFLSFNLIKRSRKKKKKQKLIQRLKIIFCETVETTRRIFHRFEAKKKK